MTLRAAWNFCKSGYLNNQALRKRRQKLQAKADALERRSWEGRIGLWCRIIGWTLFLWWAAAMAVIAWWYAPLEQHATGPFLLHAVEVVTMPPPPLLRFFILGGLLSGALLVWASALAMVGGLIVLMVGLFWVLCKAIWWGMRCCLRLRKRLSASAAPPGGAEV